MLSEPVGSVLSIRAEWVSSTSLLNSGVRTFYDVDKSHADAAKPSYQEEHGRKHKTPWNDHFIEELKRGLVACKVFIFFPVYWLVYGQMTNNLVSQGTFPSSKSCESVAKAVQAGTMELHGIPNDIMSNIDALTIIIFIPIIDRLLYPALRKIGIPFRPVTRITMGFVFGKLFSQETLSILLM